MPLTADRRGAGLKLTVLGARRHSRRRRCCGRDGSRAPRACASRITWSSACSIASSVPTHGLAWVATYVEAIRQLCAYAQRLHDGGRSREIEELLVQIGLGEYLAQIQAAYR